MPEDFHLEGDGHTKVDDLEELETLQAVNKDLAKFQRPDGQILRLTRAQLGVIAKTLSTFSDDKISQLLQFLMIADFVDGDEADDVSAAITESDRFGLDREPILIWVANRIAANRKGIRTNRVAQLYDMFSHQKFTQTVPKGKDDYARNPRSPISPA